MGGHEVFLINEMGESVGNYAGEKVKKEVMKGSEKSTADSSVREIAEWLKGAMERLDALVDEETRIRNMKPLGYHWGDGGYPRKWIDEAIEERKKYKNVDDFLEAKAEEWGYSREEDVVYHTISKPPPVGPGAFAWQRLCQPKRRCHVRTVFAQGVLLRDIEKKSLEDPQRLNSFTQQYLESANSRYTYSSVFAESDLDHSELAGPGEI